MAPPWITAFVVVVVTSAWAASLAAGIITSVYTPLETTTPIMAICVGYATGVSIVRRQRENGHGEWRGGSRNGR